MNTQEKIKELIAEYKHDMYANMQPYKYELYREIIDDLESLLKKKPTYCGGMPQTDKKVRK